VAAAAGRAAPVEWISIALRGWTSGACSDTALPSPRRPRRAACGRHET